MKLKRCPCGEMPKGLLILPSSDGAKYAHATGSCCNLWEIEFRTNFYDLDSNECEKLAAIAWNETKRGNNDG